MKLFQRLTIVLHLVLAYFPNYGQNTFDNYADFSGTLQSFIELYPTSNYTGEYQIQDAWVVKVDSAGCEIANCNVGINEIGSGEIKLQIIPNPARDEINISLADLDLKDFEINIYNLLGQSNSIASTKIDISEFSPRVYFVSATSKDGKQRFVSKFIKEL